MTFSKKFKLVLYTILFTLVINYGKAEEIEETVSSNGTLENSLESTISNEVAENIINHEEEETSPAEDYVNNNNDVGSVNGTIESPFNFVESYEENVTTPNVFQQDFDEMAAANLALNLKLTELESRLHAVEGLVSTLTQDVHYYHPTIEAQYVDMQVVQWRDALRSGLRNVAITFQAGFSLGAQSNWEFSLVNENDALTVNLLLIEEQYGRGALFAGFTVFVLNNEGNMYSQANALPVNFLDGNGRNLHLPNVIPLSEITNSSNGLLSEGDVFRIRFRLELLGVGHKLYPDNAISLNQKSAPSAKDSQTAVFDVADILGKVSRAEGGVGSSANSSTVNRQRRPIAFTRFILRHDAWEIETDWSAELHVDESGNAISLHVILEECPWSELHASFNMEIWEMNTKRLIHTQGTPINNFVKDKITIDSLLLVSQLREHYEDDEVLTLRFKLQFVVYGKTARYYADVV